MKNQELFELRKKGYLKFNTPKETIAKLEDIIKGSQIPLVAGYKDFDPKEWKVVYIDPQELSDKLTIENFLEGLRKVKDNIEELKRFEDMKQDFHGIINYEGVERFHYSEKGTCILSLFVNEKKDSSRNYALYVTIGKNQTYKAKTTFSTSKFEKIMEKHLGPNKQES